MGRVEKTVSPHRVPKEITDIIISLLHTGNSHAYKSLCNCALVCRDWLPASRHYLLKDIGLDSDRQYSLFVSNVVRSPKMSTWFPSTRQITLGAFPEDEKSLDGRDMQTASRLCLRELGGKFPKLEVLEIINLNWDTRECSVPRARMFITFGAFTSVQTLSLTETRFPSFGTMRCAIIALPSLIDLRIRDVTWPIQRSILPLRSTQKSEFLGGVCGFILVGLDSPLVEEMFGWLSDTAFGTSLAKIWMESTMLLKGSEVWRYAGSSVTQLALKFEEVKGELADDMFVETLRHFTQLQSLQPYVVIRNSTLFDPWEFIANFLSTASPHPDLKFLSLSIDFAILPSVKSAFLANGCEFVFKNASALEAIIDNSFKGLRAMELKLYFRWRSEQSDGVRTQFSQAAMERESEKKFSKISVKVIFVSHSFYSPEDSTAPAVSSS